MNTKHLDTPYFAAIDLGSNSFHMLIVQMNDGTIERIDRVKEMVQIARGLSKDKALSLDAQERALHCLRCFQERIRDIPPTQIRAVGTKALRVAGHASGFLQRAEEALGHSIDIISGYEEARLVYLGVSHDISPDKGKHLVIDIGGGSTEFIIGEDKQTRLMESLSMGCVTFSDRFFIDDKGNMSEKLSTEMIWQAYYASCVELEIIARRYCNEGWHIAVGSSGTMKSVAQLMDDSVVTGVITRAGINRLMGHLHQHGMLAITASLSPERRNVLPAGIIMLAAILEQLSIEEIHVVESSLKEGLIFDTLGKLSDNDENHDIRDQTVEKMMVQYQVDRQQAQRVDVALAHFAKELPLPIVNGIAVKKILHWAAQLHEIGLSISHSGFHHHGHYLIRESDMAGFSRFEQELLALLVGSHRRKIRSERLTLLTADPQDMLYPLLACLRLAALLNHRREDAVELPTMTIGSVTMSDNHEHLHITLRFAEGWLAEHPLTAVNLAQETEYLKPLGIVFSYQ